MNFQLLKLSLNSLKANPGRTALTILGMVIGIASVIIIYSAGEGIKGLVMSQVESFGSDFLETEIKVPTGKKGFQGDQQSGAALAQGVQVTTLKLRDMEDINKLPNVLESYAGILSQDQASYGNEFRKISLLGVSASYLSIDRSELDYGRFFTESEDKSLAQVIVLGSKMKEKLFGDSDPIGKMVKIHNSKYMVIGVMKKRGAAGFMDFDDYVYMPIRTLQKKIMGIEHVLYMVHKLKDMSVAEDTAEEVRLILRDNHNVIDENKDDFRVVTMTEMLETLDTVTNALTLLLLSIVAISLIVGGIGIMNVMYVIVVERTVEIGLRKAVGARFSDIMWQFIIEAVLISLSGGLIGICLGVLISYVIAYGAGQLGFSWEFSVPASAFFVATIFSLVFGVLFGVYPARRAAKLNPIEALRAEV